MCLDVARYSLSDSAHLEYCGFERLSSRQERRPTCLSARLYLWLPLLSTLRHAMVLAPHYYFFPHLSSDTWDENVPSASINLPACVPTTMCRERKLVDIELLIGPASGSSPSRRFVFVYVDEWLANDRTKNSTQNNRIYVSAYPSSNL